MNINLKKIKYNNCKINLGIEILRMLLCFWVISFHCSGLKYKILRTFFHVPTFMLISFYFSYNLFEAQNIAKIKNRIERLLIPFIIIPIINILIILPGLKTNIKFIINDLFLQYITGYKTLVSLWFIQILILFTIFFEIIFYFFKKKSLLILRLLAIISYWVQYSEYNYKIFSNHRPHLRSVSHIAEMIPIAVTGINICSIKLLKTLNNSYKESIFVSIIVLYFIYNYKVFGEFNGFPYSGIRNNLGGLCLFISFSIIPLYNLNNTFYFNIIREISKYTGGIYYFHPIIFTILNRLTNFHNKSIFKCVIIYIIGYLICFIGTKIFGRNKFKYLFN